MFPAGIRAAPFPAYAWLPPARLLLEPVNGSRTLYVDMGPHRTAGLARFSHTCVCATLLLTEARRKDMPALTA